MDTFQVLGVATRRNIVELLASRGQLSSSEISSQFPVSASAISQHLKVLRESSVVTVEKRAQRRLYRVNPKTIMELETWVNKLKHEWNTRLDRLESVLSKGNI